MKECRVCGRCFEDEAVVCPGHEGSLERTLEGSPLIDGKYRLEACLGRGGMGAVYSALHLEIRKRFALKLMKDSCLSNPLLCARFHVEAMALGKLQHPHIVQVTDYGIDPRSNGLPYLVMERLEGRTLSGRLEAGGAFPVAEALPLLESLAEAIDHAHEAGILHRDLNPRNVFLLEDRGGRQVKILDFGLARVMGLNPAGPIHSGRGTGVWAPGPERREEDAGATLTQIPRSAGDDPLPPSVGETGEAEAATLAGSTMGTPGYISPEILRGEEPTSLSDVFSFGVIVQEVLTGCRPAPSGPTFPSGLRAAALPIGGRPVVELPGGVEAAIRSALDPRPARRPADAGSLVRLLRRGFAVQRYREWKRKECPRRAGLAAILASLLFLAGLGAPGVPVFRGLENIFIDARFASLPARPPDPRIMLIAIDDATLQADPRPLADKADEMGALLQQVMNAGPAGIAIDFLLPERWNQSEAFTAFILKNRRRLVLADYITADGARLGAEVLTGLAMAALGSPEKAEALFGFINLVPDADGRIRRAFVWSDSGDGRPHASMPGRAFGLMTGAGSAPPGRIKPVWLDSSIEGRRYLRIPWLDLRRTLAARPEVFRDKFVFVGGDYQGSQDFHVVPRLAGEISGLTIQALVLDTLLRGRLVKEPGRVMQAAAAAGVAFLILFLLWIQANPLPAFLLILLGSLGYCALAFFLFLQTRTLLQIAGPLIFWLGSGLAGAWLRRWLPFVAKEV